MEFLGIRFFPGDPSLHPCFSATRKATLRKVGEKLCESAGAGEQQQAEDESGAGLGLAGRHVQPGVPAARWGGPAYALG